MSGRRRATREVREVREVRGVRWLDALVEALVAVLALVSLAASVVYRFASSTPNDHALAVAHLALAVAFAGWLATGRRPPCRCQEDLRNVESEEK